MTSRPHSCTPRVFPKLPNFPNAWDTEHLFSWFLYSKLLLLLYVRSARQTLLNYVPFASPIRSRHVAGAQHREHFMGAILQEFLSKNYPLHREQVVEFNVTSVGIYLFTNWLAVSFMFPFLLFIQNDEEFYKAGILRQTNEEIQAKHQLCTCFYFKITI